MGTVREEGGEGWREGGRVGVREKRKEEEDKKKGEVEEEEEARNIGTEGSLSANWRKEECWEKRLHSV